jgi:hypothetical protein
MTGTFRSIRLLKQTDFQTTERQVGILTVPTVKSERDIQQKRYDKQTDSNSFGDFAFVLHIFFSSI